MNLNEIDLSNLTYKEKMELLGALEEQENRRIHSKLYHNYFVEGSELSIDKYPKHKLFFDMGATSKQRLLTAGNRAGKSFAAAFEVTCHAIGWYPSWWKGRRVEHQKGRMFKIWAIADNNTNCRDVLQEKFLGCKDTSESTLGFGTGFIPKNNILSVTRKPGVNGLADCIYVKNSAGGVTEIQLKSYTQDREAFQGQEIDIIWMDEEPPEVIYEESILRTITGFGMIMLTFTPLRGTTKLIGQYMKNNKENPVDYGFVNVSSFDVPHLDREEINKIMAGIPKWQVNSRIHGIPSIGSGAIYGMDIETVTVVPFELPKYYKKVYSMDIGWNTTAILFGAVDPNTDVTYIYDELYLHEKQPHEYARMIRAKGGEWMPGVIDTASLQSNQKDGSKIFNILKNQEKLLLNGARKEVEAGILQTYDLLIKGKLKIFKNCKHTLEEFVMYNRDIDGKVVKRNDHAMDAMRYMVMSGINIAKSHDEYQRELMLQHSQNYYSGGSWSG